MTPYEIIIVLYFLMWYFLIALAILFIISGLDDLYIDITYWSNYLARKWKSRKYEPLTYQKLINKDEQMIAILVPCWNEVNVIGTMLRHNSNSMDYHRYYFFIGVYPNDPETVVEVQGVEAENAHIKCVINHKPGPTNKAENLNNIYLYIREFEKLLNKKFDIFVFHDSEDIIHPRSFLLYNYLIPRKEMVQIPVFPLEVPYRNFTHWLYADEFSENHTKDIIVREKIHGHVPSAGVGTAFSRQALELLEDPETKTPFSTDSLTEDYRTSLAIRILNLKQIFVTQKVERLVWRKIGILRRRYVKKHVKEFIATPALFPMEYKKAVRQKARWIIGIVFQEWEHTKWPTKWILRYTLAHDRKSFITHFINGFGYFVFLFWLLYSFFTYAKPEYPSLQEQLTMHPWVWWLIIVVSFLMLHRMVQRIIALKRVYSWIPALLSIPRVLYGNILNLHALLRAYSIYYKAPKAQDINKKPIWDKTEHHFPGSHILVPYKRRLGELLLEKNLLTQEDLKQAVLEQQLTGERLGHLLCRKKFISPYQLTQLLSMQYNLDIFPRSKLIISQKKSVEKLSEKTSRWLIRNEVIPVSFDSDRQLLTLAIEDPTNEYLIERAINYIFPYKAKFVIIDSVN